MAWMEQLNYLDFLLLAIIGASVLASVIRGFTRELAGLLALVVGVLVGLWFHGALASVLMNYISSPEIARMVGFGVIFFGIVVIGGFVGSAAAKVLQVTGLSLFDRLAGGAFGFVKGCLFCAVILLAMLAFNPGGPPAALNKSFVAPYVIWSADLIAALAPADIKAAVARNAKAIEEGWRGHGPSFGLPEARTGDNASGPSINSKKRPAGKAKSFPQ